MLACPAQPRIFLTSRFNWNATTIGIQTVREGSQEKASNNRRINCRCYRHSKHCGIENKKDLIQNLTRVHQEGLGSRPSEMAKSGSEIKIISFTDERMLIRHILEHLNLWQQRIPKGLPTCSKNP